MIRESKQNPSTPKRSADGSLQNGERAGKSTLRGVDQTGRKGGEKMPRRMGEIYISVPSWYVQPCDGGEIVQKRGGKTMAPAQRAIARAFEAALDKRGEDDKRRISSIFVKQGGVLCRIRRKEKDRGRGSATKKNGRRLHLLSGEEKRLGKRETDCLEGERERQRVRKKSYQVKIA